MSNVPESGTVKIANLVSKLKEEGADIISFSMGEPDFHTPDNINEACVRSLDDHFTHYTPSAGIPELRKAVAERVAEEQCIPCKDKQRPDHPDQAGHLHDHAGHGRRGRRGHRPGPRLGDVRGLRPVGRGNGQATPTSTRRTDTA